MLCGVFKRLEIASVHRESDSTMIYAMHDLIEAMTLATRIAVLQEGRIGKTGKLQSCI